MTVGLEKLVQDIKTETIIWPIDKIKNTPEEDAAWDRIGAKNKMSGNHVKSIFKVLSKKYETEKSKPKTNWKLFESLKFLDEINEPEAEEEDDIPDDVNLEDDGEFVELLEVNEFDDSDYEEENESAGTNSTQSSTRNVSVEEESQPKSTAKPPIKQQPATETSKNQFIQKTQVTKTNNTPPSQQPPKKYSTPSQNTPRPTTGTTDARKILLPQQRSLLSSSNTTPIQQKKANGAATVDERKNDASSKNKAQTLIQKRPEVQKRKISSDTNDTPKLSDSGHKEYSPPSKKSLNEINLPQGIRIERHLKQSSSEPSRNSSEKSSISIQKPSTGGNKTSSNGTTTATQNGLDTKTSTVILTEVKKEIDCPVTIKKEQIDNDSVTNGAEIVLPAFFRDLYNSKKYDCFGMYVSSAMNRLPTHLASKLEAKILQAIIEVNANV